MFMSPYLCRTVGDPENIKINVRWSQGFLEPPMAVKVTHIGRCIRVDYGGCYYRGTSWGFWRCLILPGGVKEGSTKRRNLSWRVRSNPENNSKHLVLTLSGTTQKTLCAYKMCWINSQSSQQLCEVGMTMIPAPFTNKETQAQGS